MLTVTPAPEVLFNRLAIEAGAYAKQVGSMDATLPLQREISLLHDEIVKLFARLDGYKPTFDKGLHYAEVLCQELDAEVMVGYELPPGRNPWVVVMEVWANGINIMRALTNGDITKLANSALADALAKQAARDRVLDSVVSA